MELAVALLADLANYQAGNLTRAYGIKNSPRGAERDLVNVANEPYQPQVPHEAATTRAAGNFHTIHSWPDDEEEQRQQHSYRHRSNIYAVLPIAPPVRKSNFRCPAPIDATSSP